MNTMQSVNEADWTLFRKKLPGWQEAELLSEEVITLDDLDEFSEDPKERFAWMMNQEG